MSSFVNIPGDSGRAGKHPSWGCFETPEAGIKNMRFSSLLRSGKCSFPKTSGVLPTAYLDQTGNRSRKLTIRPVTFRNPGDLEISIP
jgi:hypothetical protein